MGALTSPRYGHSAVLLPGGKVLVAGGLTTGGAPITGAELFDPATGRWTATGPLAAARAFHSATLLPSGQVLAVGGSGAGSTALASAERYDAVTGTWSPAGALAAARASHSATLLRSGKVLVAGGWGPAPLTSAEWYDPASGQWTAAGTMATARQSHAAALLSTGQVLVAGGAPPAASELFDEVLGTQVAWTPDVVGALPDLGAGQVLPLGGSLFTGLAEGSTGSVQASPANYPLVRLRRAGNDQLTWARVTDFSAATLSATLPAGLWPGYHWVTVVTSGAASRELPLRIRIPAVVTPARPAAPPRGSVALGVIGGGTGYAWRISVDGSGGARVDPASGLYAAGPLGGTTDTVVVSDWMGPAGQVTVKVTAGLAIFGAEFVPPGARRPSLRRAAAGPASPGPSRPTARAGASTPPPGPTSPVPSATSSITAAWPTRSATSSSSTWAVTAGVSVAPASATLDVGATQSFTASGGSGTGFTWSLAPAGSGGQIDPVTGAYRSGPAGGTADLVQVTDSLGNIASASVTVRPTATAAKGGCGCGQGGADLSLLSLALLALARLRRRSHSNTETRS